MRARFEASASAIVCHLGGRVAGRDASTLCESLRAILQTRRGPSRVVCDVRHLSPADVAAADALARLQLVARRSGTELRLLHARRELLELLDLMGLERCVPSCDSGLELGRKAEEREQALGVEEEADPRDLAPLDFENL